MPNLAPRRRAKIVATVGPASWDEASLERLFEAGADLCRLNLSHGKPKEHRETIHRIRAVSARLGIEVGVIADLMGPRYRLGTINGGRRELVEGEVLTLGDQGNEDLPVSGDEIVDHLKKGERVLIGDGLIELEVVSKRLRRVRVRVVSGGPVSNHKGLNLPDSKLPFTISRKDRRDIRMAVEEGTDYIAASYVGTADDLNAVRRGIKRAGGDIPIIAKLERGRAIDHLEELVLASDAVMVARGDLGVEVPLHQVPVLQKRIIDAAWRLGRPVIVATQMLESMMENPRPTRAESSDVANAVFDGADALMLSGESAAGRHPIKAVQTMARIIHEAERYHRRHAGSSINAPGAYNLDPPDRPGTLEIPETVSAAAVMSAHQTDAVAIVALTQGGFTARQIAGRRPSRPVFALTQSVEAARHLRLVWGVESLLFDERVEQHTEVVELVDRLFIAKGIAKVGDIIVVLHGDPIRERPPTNLMRIHRVRAPAHVRRRKARS